MLHIHAEGVLPAVDDVQQGLGAAQRGAGRGGRGGWGRAPRAGVPGARCPAASAGWLRRPQRLRWRRRRRTWGRRCVSSSAFITWLLKGAEGGRGQGRGGQAGCEGGAATVGRPPSRRGSPPPPLQPAAPHARVGAGGGERVAQQLQRLGGQVAVRVLPGDDDDVGVLLHLGPQQLQGRPQVGLVGGLRQGAGRRGAGCVGGPRAQPAGTTCFGAGAEPLGQCHPSAAPRACARMKRACTPGRCCLVCASHVRRMASRFAWACAARRGRFGGRGGGGSPLKGAEAGVEHSGWLPRPAAHTQPGGVPIRPQPTSVVQQREAMPMNRRTGPSGHSAGKLCTPPPPTAAAAAASCCSSCCCALRLPGAPGGGVVGSGAAGGRQGAGRRWEAEASCSTSCLKLPQAEAGCSTSVAPAGPPRKPHPAGSNRGRAAQPTGGVGAGLAPGRAVERVQQRHHVAWRAEGEQGEASGGASPGSGVGGGRGLWRGVQQGWLLVPTLASASPPLPSAAPASRYSTLAGCGVWVGPGESTRDHRPPPPPPAAAGCSSSAARRARAGRSVAPPGGAPPTAAPPGTNSAGR